MIVLAISEQYAIRRKRQSLPGFSFVPPFVGMLFQMILSPWSFYQKLEALGDMAYTSVVGKSVIHVRDTATTRKIYASRNFELHLSWGARAILSDNCIAFLHGNAHKELKKQLFPLFTPKAISTYIPVQERCIRTFINKWLDECKGLTEFRPLARDMNMAASIDSFVGPRNAGRHRLEIIRLYYIMNQGFLSFPINLPGTTLWKSIKAREALIALLIEIGRDCHKNLLAGAEPEGMIDVWIKHMIERDGRGEMPYKTLETVAYAIMSFMFASQDATTSALVWTLALMADHPDWLARVREEQKRLRPNNEAITLDLMNQMEHTTMAVKEILRYRPPAIMVPVMAKEDTVVGKDQYVAEKGTVFLPSIWCSSFQGFHDAHKFDPSRFDSLRREDEKFAEFFLVFGSGLHMCLGQEYAKNQLKVFLALSATLMEWEWKKTPGCDEIIFGPTIFPKDGCQLVLRPRVHASA